MTSGRANQTIVLEDGRRLGFAEFGAPGGRPVFHFHGSAASRLERPPSEPMLVDADVRFISVDRPGHGLSDFQPARRLIDWPDDVRQLADHLALERFWVEGYSAGGPYALACARLLPERVIAGALVSSAAPMDRPGALSGLPLPNMILAASSRWLPWLVRLVRRVMRRSMTGDIERSVRRLMSSIPDVDKEILYESRNAEVFGEAIREGLRPGSRGVTLDDVLIHRDWGFDLGGLEPRIDIWQGTADVNVPPSAAGFLSDAIPGARMTMVPGEGHFFVFERWRDILTQLVDGTDGAVPPR